MPVVTCSLHGVDHLKEGSEMFLVGHANQMAVAQSAGQVNRALRRRTPRSSGKRLRFKMPRAARARTAPFQALGAMDMGELGESLGIQTARVSPVCLVEICRDQKHQRPRLRWMAHLIGLRPQKPA